MVNYQKYYDDCKYQDILQDFYNEVYFELITESWNLLDKEHQKKVLDIYINTYDDKYKKYLKEDVMDDYDKEYLQYFAENEEVFDLLEFYLEHEEELAKIVEDDWKEYEEQREIDYWWVQGVRI